MKEIYLLDQSERENFFRVAAETSKISFEIIEKDYWVVWTLERLFALEELKTHLTFKGGTSLSKAYRIIDRFSEDIDLSIERSFLGFGETRDPERQPSKNKQRETLNYLSAACSTYVQNKMLTDLKTAIVEKLGTIDGWKVEVDASDSQTLNFEYPSVVPKNNYIRPFVKIEMGARSEHWPVSEHKIQSYVKEALQEKVHENDVILRVLNAERTFWEKATILHQYAHLPNEKSLPPRISRHFYDFFCLLISPVKEKALRDLSLLERVAIHKSVYFASGWANYKTARKGTLKLSPLPTLSKELKNDYALMEAMFFRDRPGWDLILKTIEEFERDFNS
ncbi:MAG: hypothetical protein COV44_07590 [Deltaproteobacteria bacterium CG11_big_fil_rev_8_21_14_0_20_45_16]|nr:MAG: hypothetical protein COV44_07590 [Deltaproteobacteria bacterium CG11_big_fil_rev_8_21_14_0_20_45_16]